MSDKKSSQRLTLGALFNSSLLLLVVAATQMGCQKEVSAPLKSFGGQGIVNGTVATGTEPWAHSVVGLATKTLGTTSIYCSGTLINEKTVVTAAHCVDAMSEGDVVVFGLTEGGATTQTRKIVRHKLHEEYKSYFPDEARDVFDIGIAEFEGGMPEGYVPAGILYDDVLLVDGADVMLAGYGVTSGAAQQESGTLRYTTVKIKEAAYGKSELKTNEVASGSCNGDSGGPGFIEKDGKFYVWGATSRGDAYCHEEGVYTKVTSFQDWIKTSLAEWANPTSPTKPGTPNKPTPPSDDDDGGWKN